MNKSLTRSIAFWLLLVLSLASAGVGGWIISGQLSTMTTTLLDGTATGVEVYVGQSLVVFGAALVGAGVLGLLIAVALVAVQSLVAAAKPVTVEAIDWTSAADGSAPENETPEHAASDTAEADEAATHRETGETVSTPDAEHVSPEGGAADEDQNGSSGSIATATKINVK
ncbi:hypothetical protein ACI3KS_02195 [Microbacterium sp. ZW T5_45]|uniref:hypothetical protein n=1 Tax=Microbacterium sp. ZW T5_45 TaxID=3378080 RepID=UPI003853F4EF